MRNWPNGFLIYLRYFFLIFFTTFSKPFQNKTKQKEKLLSEVMFGKMVEYEHPFVFKF
jgi:preprotein translocase subunit YajC